MGSMVISQQAPVQWPREITKAKLFIGSINKQWKKRQKEKGMKIESEMEQFLGKIGKVIL